MANERYNCPCGSSGLSYQPNSKEAHFRSKQHRTYVEQNPDWTEESLEIYTLQPEASQPAPKPIDPPTEDLPSVHCHFCKDPNLASIAADGVAGTTNPIQTAKNVRHYYFQADFPNNGKAPGTVREFLDAHHIPVFDTPKDQTDSQIRAYMLARLRGEPIPTPEVPVL
jgi:hypothetical protein